MPTPEEYQKRLERLYSVSVRLKYYMRACELFTGPYYHEGLINAKKEFRDAVQKETNIRQGIETDLPF